MDGESGESTEAEDVVGAQQEKTSQIQRDWDEVNEEKWRVDSSDKTRHIERNNHSYI